MGRLAQRVNPSQVSLDSLSAIPGGYMLCELAHHSKTHRQVVLRQLAGVFSGDGCPIGHMLQEKLRIL